MNPGEVICPMCRGEQIITCQPEGQTLDCPRCYGSGKIKPQSRQPDENINQQVKN